MTPEERINWLQAELDAKGHTGEALGIAWCELWGLAKEPKSGEYKQVRINLTSRSYVGPRQALDQLMDALAHARELKMHPYLPIFPTSPAPTKEPSPETVARYEAERKAKEGAELSQTQSSKVVPPPVHTAQVTDEAQPKPEQFMRIGRMEVIPKPDGRVDLKFYDPNPGMKYAVLSVNNWTVESALKLLEPTGAWEADHLAKANQFTVNYKAFYVLSEKTNTKGLPYKNVVRLEVE
jgi:hypothetical protein